MSQPRSTLLDACAVVSLYASRRMADILGAVPTPCAIVDVVEREAQYVLKGGTNDDAREREPVALGEIIAGGIVSIAAAAADEELATYILLTERLNRGEAMTAAVAIHRGYAVVTDDRKAERVLGELGVPLRSTLDLVKAWFDGDQLDAAIQRQVLLDIRQRGTYKPPKRHPLRSWWDGVMSVG